MTGAVVIGRPGMRANSDANRTCPEFRGRRKDEQRIPPEVLVSPRMNRNRQSPPPHRDFVKVGDSSDGTKFATKRLLAVVIVNSDNWNLLPPIDAKENGRVNPTANQNDDSMLSGLSSPSLPH